MPALIISLLALLATFYQLYLQRIHNEKSLKPLVQIDLTDDAGLLYVHIQNNGVGPLIVERLTFFKGGKSYTNIEDCLTLDPASYQRVPINESVRKILLPGTFLEVFRKRSEKENTDTKLAEIRRQLAALRLKVEGRDIYNNKVVAERDLRWFVRHQTKSSLSVID